jgi:hypothetical protein
VFRPGTQRIQLSPEDIDINGFSESGSDRKAFLRKDPSAQLKGCSVVSFHLRSIYDKLQVHSKPEAVAKAIRSRLI